MRAAGCSGYRSWLGNILVSAARVTKHVRSVRLDALFANLRDDLIIAVRASSQVEPGLKCRNLLKTALALPENDLRRATCITAWTDDDILRRSVGVEVNPAHFECVRKSAKLLRKLIRSRKSFAQRIRQPDPNVCPRSEASSQRRPARVSLVHRTRQVRRE
jgi:hypothetical protein